jgi:UTP--glucose-1-phosphate uridylyltransferase
MPKTASIRKAVIPAAGFGTRMLPAAKAVPKEMLPVLDKPVIQYVVEEAAAARLEDVLLITSREKRAIEDHFDRNSELEGRLRGVGRDTILKYMVTLSAGPQIHTVRQHFQNGLGDAVKQARQHVGNEPFVCLLGDTIFSGDSPAQQLVEIYREFGTSVIGLEEVPPEKVSRYGIVGGVPVREGVLQLDQFIEKPAPDVAPSRFAIAARYVLTPAIFDALDQTTPGKGGEVQLTDALRILCSREPVHGVVLRGKRHDIGNPIDWLKTNLLFASRDASVWTEIAPLVEELLRESDR